MMSITLFNELHLWCIARHDVSSPGLYVLRSCTVTMKALCYVLGRKPTHGFRLFNDGQSCRRLGGSRHWPGLSRCPASWTRCRHWVKEDSSNDLLTKIYHVWRLHLVLVWLRLRRSRRRFYFFFFLLLFSSSVEQTVMPPVHSYSKFNPLTPTVAIWVQLQSILCQTGLSRHFHFDIRALWRSALSVRVPGCQKLQKLTRSGTGCFTVVPVWQQWASKGNC